MKKATTAEFIVVAAGWLWFTLVFFLSFQLSFIHVDTDTNSHTWLLYMVSFSREVSLLLLFPIFSTEAFSQKYRDFL